MAVVTERARRPVVHGALHFLNRASELGLLGDRLASSPFPPPVRRSRPLAAAHAAHYLHETVLPQLDEFTSRAWETVCQQHVLRTVPGVTAVGRWWGPVPTGEQRRTEEREIGVVGSTATGTRSCSACAGGTNKPLGTAELHLSDRLAPHTGAAPDVRRFLCSRSGFDPRLHEPAGPTLDLVTPDDIYRRGSSHHGRTAHSGDTGPWPAPSG